jgi:hypothetical protein
MDTPDRTDRNGFVLGFVLGALSWIVLYVSPEKNARLGVCVLFAPGLLTGFFSRAGCMVLTLGVTLGGAIVMFLFSVNSGETENNMGPFIGPPPLIATIIVSLVYALVSSIGVAIGHGVRQWFWPSPPAD